MENTKSSIKDDNTTIIHDDNLPTIYRIGSITYETCLNSEINNENGDIIGTVRFTQKRINGYIDWKNEDIRQIYEKNEKEYIGNAKKQFIDQGTWVLLEK
jgi:hypothetical protein